MSSSATRLPASASAIARLIVVVDLPSLGIEPVTTKLDRPPMSRNCRLVRSARNDSARGLRGSACTISGRSFAFESKAIAPISGTSVTCATSRGDRTRLSSTLRSTAMPMLIASPTSPPSARFSGTFGLDGDSGGSASLTRVSRTGLAPSALDGSISGTALDRLAAIALARSAACTGSASSTVTVMSVVFSAADADTFLANSVEVMSRSIFAITGFSTIGVSTSPT